MKYRCHDIKDDNYHKYGARGIKVCDRWLEDFWNFSNDMGEKPTKLHTVDRIDNDGNYEPDNCRWATKKEQSRNMRSNVIVTMNGKTMCLKDWSKELGVSYDTVKTRTGRYKMTAIEALTSPSLVGNIFTFNDKTQNLKDHCKDLNLAYKAIQSRINSYGWTVEKALSTPIRKRKSI
jgi:transposase